MKKIIMISFLILSLLPAPIYGEGLDAPPGSGDPGKISLDFKGMDIVDVLKLLAQRGEMNISVSKTVRGKVTIFLKDVDIQDAFEIVISSNGLAYDIKGGIINVMTERDYEQLYGTRFDDKKEIRIFQLKYAKAAAVSKALSQVKTKIGKVVIDEASNTVVVIDAPQSVNMAARMIRKMDIPTETRIFGLDYATAEDVKAKIEERLTTDVGSIQVDERTNKIIVTDMGNKMPEIERVIAELDEKTQQVLIEAKILQITLNDEFKMGVNWDYIFHVGYNIAAGSNFTNAGLGNIIRAATGSTTGGAFQIGALNDQRHQYVIEVLESIGKTEILSAPRITVINNEEASILVGSSRPYATSGTTIGDTLSETTQNVTYVDLGVKLHVTPTINRDGFVTMKIKPEISSRTDDITVTSTTTPTSGTTVQDTTRIPIIQTSSAETTVMVKDGNTVVFAGMIETREEDDEDKIPFLGDIPLIGGAFRRTTRGNAEEDEKKELIIFLTPHIVSGEAPAPENEEYLTTTEVGKSEIRQEEEEEKLEPTRFALREGPDETTAVPVARPRKKIKARKSPSKSYSDLVRGLVYQKARTNYPRSDIRGNVYVAFDLASDGSLKGEPRVLGDAKDVLKQLAVKSVYEAAPFPPFPSGLKKPKETFKVLVSYK